MWFSKDEQAAMKPFIDFVYANESKDLRFRYNDGREFIVSLHLYEFESDNGLDAHDKNYEEYWEMAFEIINIVKDDSNKLCVGEKILVNYHNVPDFYDAV